MNVLAYTLDYDVPYFWIFGDNFIWNVDITDNENEFVEKINEQKYDILFISINNRNNAAKNSIAKFEKAGLNFEPSGDFIFFCK